MSGEEIIHFPAWALAAGAGLLGLCLTIIGALLIRILTKVDTTLDRLNHQMSDHAVRIAVIEARDR